MRNFRQTGDVVTVPAPYNALSGAGILVGTLFGVNSYDVLATADAEIKTLGVFELPKLSAQAWTVGQILYWDDTNKWVTSVAGSNVIIGKALDVAANPSAVGLVRLTGA